MAKKKALPDWVKNPPEGYIVAKSDPKLIRATSRTQAADRLRQQFAKGRTADKGSNVDASGLSMDRYFTSGDGTTYVMADTTGDTTAIERQTDANGAEPHTAEHTSKSMKTARERVRAKYRSKYGVDPPANAIKISATKGGYKAEITVTDSTAKGYSRESDRAAFDAQDPGTKEWWREQAGLDDAGAAPAAEVTTTPEQLERLGAGKLAIDDIEKAVNGEKPKAAPTRQDTSVAEGFNQPGSDGGRPRPNLEVQVDPAIEAAVEGRPLDTMLGPTATAAEKIMAARRVIDQLTDYTTELSNLAPDSKPDQGFIGPQPDDSLKPLFVDPDKPGDMAGGTPPRGVTASAEFPPQAQDIEGGAGRGDVASKIPLVFRQAEGSIFDEDIRKARALKSSTDIGRYDPEGPHPGRDDPKGLHPEVPVELGEDAPEDTTAEGPKLDLAGMEPPPEWRYTEPQAWDPTEEVAAPPPLAPDAFDRLRADSAARRVAREETESQQAPPPEKRYRKGLGGGPTAHATRRPRGEQPEGFRRPDFKPIVSSARKLIGRLGRAIQRDPGGEEPARGSNDSQSAVINRILEAQRRKAHPRGTLDSQSAVINRILEARKKKPEKTLKQLQDEAITG